jgi:Fanconi anemia group M protein
MSFIPIFGNKKVKDNNLKIIADNREKNSLVISELIKLNNEVIFEQLDIGDYLIGDVVIERKTKSDLINSIIDKRVFSQLNNLKQYQNHLLILEENNQVSNMNENAIKGFMLSLALKFKTPLVHSSSEKETAKYLHILANKKESKENPVRQNKKIESKEERVQFILEGFPSIGPVKAKELIKEFKTIRRIVNASQEELERVLSKSTHSFIEILD